jgi:type IV pilus assembly protein PilY1
LSAQYLVRPWVNGTATSANSTAFDGYLMNDSKEYVFSYTTQGHSELVPPTTFTSDALFGTNACPINRPGTLTPFVADDCNRIAFDFALGAQYAPSTWDTTKQPWPARFAGSGQLPTSAFGGVYHSTPAIATPPGALLRDDSYQSFVQQYGTSYTTYNNVAESRHTVLYVATIDGVMHAFGVDYNPTDNYTFNGTHDPTGKGNEMWAFVPPATTTHLLDGFPAAQTPILDGSPVVKDTIYQRTTVGAGSDWHTSLVSGFGGVGSIGTGGYYALDVTDPDIGRHASSGTEVDPVHSTSNSGTPPYMNTTTGLPQGPHFLWQLTGDPYLFGKYSATPAITQILMDPGDGIKREIGVVILPGGGTDLANSTVTCPRLAKITPNALPADSSYDEQPNVRQWQGGCNATRGRTLVIARLDTGEIIRVFGNYNVTGNLDLPSPSASPKWAPYTADSGNSGTNAAHYPYMGRVTQANFDSPITGTPVPYPSDVGSDALRIFVGDADGMMWRVDVSDPNPVNWYVEPFWDSMNLKIQGTSALANHTTGDVWGNSRQPIVGAPSLSIGRTGNVILNFATGDVNQVGNSTGLPNYVFSVGELADASTGKLKASVNWWKVLPNPGELVSGPSAVFDGTYYFATYVPNSTSNLCSHGEAFLWGMDYQAAASSTLQATTSPPDPPSFGGGPKLLDSTSTQVQVLDTGSAAILPGIAVTNTAACAQTETVTDYYTGSTRYDLTNSSPATYSVSALIGQNGAAGGGSSGGAAKVSQYNYTMASGVRTMTLIDSWASIVE